MPSLNPQGDGKSRCEPPGNPDGGMEPHVLESVVTLRDRVAEVARQVRGPPHERPTESEAVELGGGGLGVSGFQGSWVFRVFRVLGFQGFQGFQSFGVSGFGGFGAPGFLISWCLLSGF